MSRIYYWLESHASMREMKPSEQADEEMKLDGLVRIGDWSLCSVVSGYSMNSVLAVWLCAVAPKELDEKLTLRTGGEK